MAAIAAGAAQFPFHACRDGHDSVVADAATGRPVAYLPVPLNHIATHPAGRGRAGLAEFAGTAVAPV